MKLVIREKPKKNKSKIICIRVTEEYENTLNEIAETNKMSRSKLIHEYIAIMIDAYKNDKFSILKIK